MSAALMVGCDLHDKTLLLKSCVGKDSVMACPRRRTSFIRRCEQRGVRRCSIACPSHLLGIRSRLRQHPAAQRPCDLLRVNLVSLRLPSVNHLHGYRMPHLESDPFLATRIRQPIPSKQSLARNIEPLATRSTSFKNRPGSHGKRKCS